LGGLDDLRGCWLTQRRDTIHYEYTDYCYGYRRHDFCVFVHKLLKFKIISLKHDLSFFDLPTIPLSFDLCHPEFISGSFIESTRIEDAETSST
jgi:hypothetical protein